MDESVDLWTSDLSELSSSISSRATTSSPELSTVDTENEHETELSSCGEDTASLGPESSAEFVQLPLEPWLDMQQHPPKTACSPGSDSGFQGLDAAGYIWNQDGYAYGAHAPTWPLVWPDAPLSNNHVVYGDSSMGQPILV